MLAKLDIQEYYKLPATDQVYAWREEQAFKAGYDENLAALVAAHTEIDLRKAVDLVFQGCSPETALRILL